MSATEALRREIEAARALLATYEDILGDDAQARADAIEGETDLREAITAGIARIAEIQALQAGVKLFRDRLAQRASRLETQEQSLRAAIDVAMEIAGEKRIETPLGTASRRTVAPSVIVTNEADIPASFWKRADPALDKRALLEALKALGPDENIPGATLSNGGMTLHLALK
jgi:hypothetical protein